MRTERMEVARTFAPTPRVCLWAERCRHSEGLSRLDPKERGAVIRRDALRSPSVTPDALPLVGSHANTIRYSQRTHKL